MDDKERMQTLEDELKIIKGEIKQTLVDVRAFLMEQTSPINERLQSVSLMPNTEEDESRDVGGFDQDTLGPGEDMVKWLNSDSRGPFSPQAEPPSSPDTPPQPHPRASEKPAEAEPDEPPVPEDSETEELTDEAPEPATDSSEALEPEESRSEEDMEEIDEVLSPTAERFPAAGGSTPEVNLIANLIQWVAMAKRLIGKDLLLSFLEVYGMAGATPKGLRQAITRIAEVVGGDEPPANPENGPEAWSVLTLHLHGILSSAGATGRFLARWADRCNEACEPARGEYGEDGENGDKGDRTWTKSSLPAC